jgi:L-arabinose 1- dehydrogenase
MSYRIAVVGIGKIARDQHIPCIAKNRNFTLVAGVSRHATLENVPCFESLVALRSSKIKVDAVALCTPPGVRLAMARDALGARWHLLIEKPPTPTVGELLAMAEYARKKKRVLYATWHSRYNKSVDEAKRRLKGKKVIFLRVTWKEDVNRWHPGQQWIWECPFHRHQGVARTGFRRTGDDRGARQCGDTHWRPYSLQAG